MSISDNLSPYHYSQHNMKLLPKRTDTMLQKSQLKRNCISEPFSLFTVQTKCQFMHHTVE